MYLARRVYGCVARVYELNEPYWLNAPYCATRGWSFQPITKLCGPGYAATGKTPQLALATLHAGEDEEFNVT